MTKKLEDYLPGTHREEYNSNNAWGFGGASGRKYTIKTEPNIVLTIATASHRHLPSNKFYRITVDGTIVCDSFKKKDAEQWLEKNYK